MYILKYYYYICNINLIMKNIIVELQNKFGANSLPKGLTLELYLKSKDEKLFCEIVKNNLESKK